MFRAQTSRWRRSAGIADRAVQIHGGGAGYMAEYKVETLHRDVRLLRIYEGTTQIQQTIIARNMIRNAQ